MTGKLTIRKKKNTISQRSTLNRCCPGKRGQQMKLELGQIKGSSSESFQKKTLKINP